MPGFSAKGEFDSGRLKKELSGDAGAFTQQIFRKNDDALNDAARSKAGSLDANEQQLRAAQQQFNSATSPEARMAARAQMEAAMALLDAARALKTQGPNTGNAPSPVKPST
jgi:hypothetical protein